MEHNMKVNSKNLRVFLVVLISGLSSFSNADTTHSIKNNTEKTSQSTSIQINQVNINTANAVQLSNVLKGIGLKKAAAIIEYRKNYGPFVHIDELKAVKGIGVATIEKNQHLILLN